MGGDCALHYHSSHPTNAKRMRGLGVRFEADWLHWIDEEAVNCEGREHGSGTHHWSSKPIQPNRPSKIRESDNNTITCLYRNISIRSFANSKIILKYVFS